ncbi:hypothetical protein T02_8743 [Trichinella nativa]|uniref:Uncharacterized protein n=1 Tax=Trichinella nativa TaxID=6335 RepID=A0A0V1KWN2_9BILA|nr:hypothetical protein T02_8743 [Trichinella nativa]
MVSAAPHHLPGCSESSEMLYDVQWINSSLLSVLRRSSSRRREDILTDLIKQENQDACRFLWMRTESDQPL